MKQTLVCSAFWRFYRHEACRKADVGYSKGMKIWSPIWSAEAWVVLEASAGTLLAGMLTSERNFR